MSAQALSLRPTLPTNLRPFDARRDLGKVADLVELCFADTLDSEGRLYIRQMRQAARSGRLLEFPTGRIDTQMGGFVWVEGSRVVGNLSLVPSRQAESKLFLIANVAVHPDYRRQGIARALTEAALKEIRLRGRRQTWLQVDVRNPAAIALYKSMGFVERLQRSSWRLVPDLRLDVNARPEIMTRPQRASDWTAQQRWLKASYPVETRWQLPMELKLLQPGWRGALERAFAERQVRQWSAERAGKLLGVLTWQSSTLDADRFWLACAEGEEDVTIPALVRATAGELRPRRAVALNYPAGRAINALQSAGLSLSRTLIWMSYPWK